MSNRKKIDQLFQEKLKAFEANPSDDVWAKIEAQLDKKKKKRIVPFWWKLSGVAALLLIGFLISKSFYSKEYKQQNTIVNQESFNQSKEEKNTKKVLINDTKTKVENPVVTDYNSTTIKKINKEGIIKTAKNNSFDSTSDAIVSGSNSTKKRGITREGNKAIKSIYATKSSDKERYFSNNRSLKKKSNFEENKTAITTVLVENENQSMTAKDSKKANFDIKNSNLDELKTTIDTKIITQETVKKETDTVVKNSIVTNALEELLNEKESKLKQESKENRWQLTSNVAPIFFGSTSNGSPIDKTLSENSKSFNTSVGYGIGVNYGFNKKFSLRTGLNKVNISYDTNNILFFSGIQAKMLTNVSPTATSALLQIRSNAPNNSILNTTSESGLLPFENSFVNENKGYLNQEISYLEMPFEMTYSLVDKKFGMNIIGGFSTFLLQDNRITIVSDGRNTLLGEANNLNNIHFSTNLGLGIRYGFMKSFEFNVEPILKYQLNTFSANAGSFKPYIIGIYSGVSYKF